MYVRHCQTFPRRLSSILRLISIDKLLHTSVSYLGPYHLHGSCCTWLILKSHKIIFPSFTWVVSMVQSILCIRILKICLFHQHYTYVQLQAFMCVLNLLMLLLTLLVVWREAATDWNSWSAIEETSSKHRDACHAKKRFVS